MNLRLLLWTWDSCGKWKFTPYEKQSPNKLCWKLLIKRSQFFFFFFCRNVYIPESLPWYHHWQPDNNAEIKKVKKINKLVNQVFAWDLWRTSTHVLRVAFIIEPRIEQIEMLLFEKKYASFPRQEKNYVNNKCNKRNFIVIFSMKLQ